MKKLFFSLVMIILGFRQSYAWEYNEYLCGGNSMCYSEDSCDQETGYCDDCADNGYGHNENGVCVRCEDSNCEDCEDNYKQCDSCYDDMIIVNGRCEEEADSDTCPENCSACGVSGNCAWCDSGYYLEDGVCKQNPEGCSWYNTNIGKCEACIENHYMESNGTCTSNNDKPLTNCSAFDSQTKLCTACDNGYYLREGRCISEEECLVKGLRILNHSCLDKKCIRYWDSRGACVGCSSGYMEQEGECVTECSPEYEASTMYGGPNCLAKNCSNFAAYTYACSKCIDGYIQDGVCVTECKEGYIAGTNSSGYPSCFPADLGCGYGEKQVGDECVAREDGEGCGVGFYLKDNLCVSESKGCGDGYLGKDEVCISSANGCGAGYKDMGGWCNRIQYTPAEAAPLLKDDDNFVILTFKK